MTFKMSNRTLMLVKLFTASIVFSTIGLIEAFDKNYEELVEKMIQLENKVDRSIHQNRLNENSSMERKLSRQVKILESRIAEMMLQQTRSNRKDAALKTRINHLESQVATNVKTMEKQNAEIERLKSTKKEKSCMNKTEKVVRPGETLEKQKSGHALKQYSGGRIRRSFPEIPYAFSAVLDHNVDHSGIEQTVIFNKVLLNDGNAYNNRTGVFSVPKEGVYMFYLAFGAGYEPHKLWMHIVVDGQGKVSGVADTLKEGHDAQGTNFVVLHLNKGDSVWVTTFAVADVKIYGVSGFTTFSGVLLYEY